jgi:hypothetical protein
MDAFDTHSAGWRAQAGADEQFHGRAAGTGCALHASAAAAPAIATMTTGVAMPLLRPLSGARRHQPARTRPWARPQR